MPDRCSMLEMAHRGRFKLAGDMRSQSDIPSCKRLFDVARITAAQGLPSVTSSWSMISLIALSPSAATQRAAWARVSSAFWNEPVHGLEIVRVSSAHSLTYSYLCRNFTLKQKLLLRETPWRN